ncbi:pseudaminic acid cytidylyltransferase [Treponema sp. OMZ 840]|uniref:pseudaminic acid cytidylyltransferase n=1 Tax=Treponema sp. OMZ 840 TaxID=244313 RepID=UPI003D93035B
MKTIAIITARGGSKRIPRKNIKEFMGKPMLAYAIEAAQKSGIFDTVIVSTDDEEIAALAKNLGAEVPFMRSAKTSSDYAITYDVLEEVLAEYKKINIGFDTLCCIYPCVPFLTADSLYKAYNQMFSDSHDAVMPVCKYPVPIEWAMIISEGKLMPNDRAAQLIRSQDLVPKYYDAGMFYFCKTSALLEHKTLVPPNTGAYIIDETECQDIDTLEDWKSAELKYKIIKGA